MSTSTEQGQSAAQREFDKKKIEHEVKKAKRHATLKLDEQWVETNRQWITDMVDSLLKENPRWIHGFSSIDVMKEREIALCWDDDSPFFTEQQRAMARHVTRSILRDRLSPQHRLELAQAHADYGNHLDDGWAEMTPEMREAAYRSVRP